MIPAVTELRRCSGLPSAMTNSPTLNDFDVPSFAAGSLSSESTRSSAKSDVLNTDTVYLSIPLRAPTYQN